MKIVNVRSGGLIFLIWVALVLFVAGAAMPMLTLSKFIYIRSSFSVLSGVYELLVNGRIVLAILVGGFSVVLPVIKIVLLFKVLHSIRQSGGCVLETGESDSLSQGKDVRSSRSNAAFCEDRRGCRNPSTLRYLHLMHAYGRWAMLDVMVVAVLIVTVKLKAIASIQVHAGLYVFGGSVLLLMLITHQVVKLTEPVNP